MTSGVANNRIAPTLLLSALLIIGGGMYSPARGEAQPHAQEDISVYFQLHEQATRVGAAPVQPGTPVAKGACVRKAQQPRADLDGVRG